MKKNNEIIRYGMTDEKWENHITSKSAKLKEEFGGIAKDQAINEKPPKDCAIEEAKPYNGSMQHAFQLLVDENWKNFQVESHAEKVKRSKEDGHRELEKLVKKKTDVLNDLRVESREFDKKGIKHALPALKKKAKKAKRWIPLVLIIVGTDALVSASVLQQLDYPLWTALLIGVTIASGLFALSHMMPNIVDRAKTRAGRIAIVTGISIAVCLIFSAFASFRASSGSANSFYFVLINCFSFGCACLITFTHALTPREKEQLNSYSAIQESLHELEKQKDDLEKREEEIEASMTKAEEEYKSIIVYGKSLEQTIVSNYQGAYQYYVEQNVFHRSDQKTPLFFHDPAPTLTLHFKIQTP